MKKRILLPGSFVVLAIALATWLPLRSAGASAQHIHPAPCSCQSSVFLGGGCDECIVTWSLPTNENGDCWSMPNCSQISGCWGDVSVYFTGPNPLCTGGSGLYAGPGCGGTGNASVACPVGGGSPFMLVFCQQCQQP